MKKIILLLIFINYIWANENYFINPNKIFIGFGVNMGEMEIGTTLDETISINPQEEAGSGYTIQAGYEYNNRLKLNYNIKKFGLDDGSFTFNYFSFDYQLTSREPFYMGLDYGTGEYSWEKSPYSVASENDTELSSSIFGLHLGYPFIINENLEFSLQLNFLKSDFITKIINPNVEGTINHKELIDISLALRYKFK